MTCLGTARVDSDCCGAIVAIDRNGGSHRARLFELGKGFRKGKASSKLANGTMDKKDFLKPRIP